MTETYLLIKLNKRWLEMLRDVLASYVIFEHRLTVTFAFFSLLGNSRGAWRPREGVKRHLLILCITNLIEFVVRYSFVCNHSRIVCRNEAWEFREVRRHLLISSIIIL